MSLTEIIQKIASEFPPGLITDAKEYAETFYCRSCNDVTKVDKPGDLCAPCVAEKERGYQALNLAGRCANGFEMDHGTRIHAVKFGNHTAMCGAKPGRRSVGWTTPYRSRDITCPRCLKKLPAT